MQDSKPMLSVSGLIAGASLALAAMGQGVQNLADAFDSTAIGLQSAKATLRHVKSRPRTPGPHRPAGSKLARRAGEGTVGKAVLR